MPSLALDLDAVLADTRPLWNDWLEDASRRTRVELDVPEDRGGRCVAARRAARRLAAAARALRRRSRARLLPAAGRDERAAAAPPGRGRAARRLHGRAARARGRRARARRRCASSWRRSGRSTRCSASSATARSSCARVRSSRRRLRSRIQAWSDDLSDRRFDVLLERLDRIGDELTKMNKRLDNDENFLRLTRELALAERVAAGDRVRGARPAGAASPPPPTLTGSDPVKRTAAVAWPLRPRPPRHREP